MITDSLSSLKDHRTSVITDSVIFKHMDSGCGGLFVSHRSGNRVLSEFSGLCHPSQFCFQSVPFRDLCVRAAEWAEWWGEPFSPSDVISRPTCTILTASCTYRSHAFSLMNVTEKGWKLLTKFMKKSQFDMFHRNHFRMIPSRWSVLSSNLRETKIITLTEHTQMHTRQYA